MGACQRSLGQVGEKIYGIGRNARLVQGLYRFAAIMVNHLPAFLFCSEFTVKVCIIFNLFHRTLSGHTGKTLPLFFGSLVYCRYEQECLFVVKDVAAYVFSENIRVAKCVKPVVL